jgi:acetyl esterase/lipase
MYARWAAGDMGEDDQWGDVTAEPRGLDYAEVSADGVQAMWLVPHGAGPEVVIVALHGGGFVSHSAVPAGGDQRPGAGGQRLPRRPVCAAAGVRAALDASSPRARELLSTPKA